MSKQSFLSQEESKILHRVTREIIILSLAGALIISFFSVSSGLFLLAGGLFSALSFYWLKDSFSKYFLFNKKKKMTRLLVGNYILRILLIIAVFSIIIIFFPKRIIAFVAGFSTIIIVFLAETVAMIPKMKKWKN